MIVVFFPLSINMLYYADQFLYFELPLHSWDASQLLICIILLICYWILFASVLLRIFASVFIRDISLQFSYLVMSLPGFHIKVMLAS